MASSGARVLFLSKPISGIKWFTSYIVARVTRALWDLGKRTQKKKNDQITAICHGLVDPKCGAGTGTFVDGFDVLCLLPPSSTYRTFALFISPSPSRRIGNSEMCSVAKLLVAPRWRIRLSSSLV